MSNRRTFIKSAAASTLLASPLISFARNRGKKNLKILILGGTGFLGPHTVNAALARGHEVTLFNRGKTNPDLFHSLETINGDRNTDDIKKLSGRKWDLVIDTSAYYPRSINMAMDVLKQNIKQYLFVSTISVYSDWSKKGMDESAPVGTLDDPSTENITGETYGPLKALCEQAAEQHMPGKVCTVRPGLIVGPRDKTDRFTYWPVRVKRGGEVLAPNDGSDFIQFIDVRDLAEWMIYLAEQNINGIFNAQSKAADITMGQLLNQCVKLLNPSAKLVWVNTDFLEENQVAPWQEMPVWLPAKGDYAAAGTISSEKAIANGLKFRPLDITIADTYQWFSQLPEKRQSQLRAGISQEKEAAVITAWQSRETSS